jgi:hypothetical protein
MKFTVEKATSEEYWEPEDHFRIQSDERPKYRGWGCLDSVVCVTDSEKYANLICAAPDFLAACKELLDFMYLNQVKSPIDERIESMAHKAIAKAEGRNQV